METTRMWVPMLVAVVIVGTGIYILWQRTASLVAPNTATSTQKIQDSGAVSFGITHTPETISVPNLKTPIHFSPSISEDARAALNARLAKTRAEIEKNSRDFNEWVILGGLYKMGGDYQRAATVWEYVSLAWSSNDVSFSNLGDLYMNFLHDYPKASTRYLTALENNRINVQTYLNLFTLYTSGKYTPSSGAAEDILKKGIRANTTSATLQVTLARYYVSKNRVADAKAQFDLAIKNAQTAGQTTLVGELQKEEASL